MSETTVYLVTGSNRGLGLGLVTRILEKHDHAFVYAGARNPEKAQPLQNLQAKYPNRISVVKCVSADVEGNTALAREIEKRHGRLDTVIANAAICDTTGDVSNISVPLLEEHFHVNVTGTIVLFQAVYGLLKKSISPRFVPISSSVGCLDSDSIKHLAGGLAYGASKAALNWATRKIHFENEWLVAFPLSPGATDTDMLRGNVAADTTGYLEKLYGENTSVPTVEAVSSSLINIIDKSTRDNDGGRFIHVDGTQIPW
ncbi:hypothetical protein HYPSUDRAFT_41169 [Hypholoma sublateritium FD-334 SS-4]|uniref:Ketoreductase (KR) domain-containing protein n=1 Tax=Hypholoma sublateritium (strain FD-334 SS-4) TaxID=945553 RepID=A0A0D2P0Q2_HYPSF|nr:hypothetical protein HYPSUDRAFT_41169 [Hypholoma sublateritium FD-334 SS-4]